MTQPYRMFCYKDINHAIIECSDETLRCSGYKSKDEIVGKTDYDFPWCDYAKMYHHHETEIFKGNIYSTLIPLIDHEGNTSIFLHNKYCEYDEEGQFLRLVCFANELKNLYVYDLTKLISNTKEKKVFSINNQNPAFSLSERQQQCLFYLLQGKSVHQIAKILQLSKRTVEYYLELIKLKFNCHSKSELCEKAIQHGYLSIIPSGCTIKQLVEGLKS